MQVRAELILPKSTHPQQVCVAAHRGCGSPVALPLYNKVCNNALSADLLTAFVMTRQGLERSTRPSLQSPFERPRLKLAVADTGPFDGPIWVSADQRRIYYCSPGVGATVGSSRKLWMIEMLE